MRRGRGRYQGQTERSSTDGGGATPSRSVPRTVRRSTSAGGMFSVASAAGRPAMLLGVRRFASAVSLDRQPVTSVLGLESLLLVLPLQLRRRRPSVHTLAALGPPPGPSRTRRTRCTDCRSHVGRRPGTGPRDAPAAMGHESAPAACGEVDRLGYATCTGVCLPGAPGPSKLPYGTFWALGVE